MSRVNVGSGSPYEDPIGFCRAVRIGDTIAVSGTAPITDDGTTASPGDLYGQTKRCLQIIKAAIESAGGTLEDVIRTRIYLIDISRWQEAAKAHGEVFSAIKPASTFCQVAALIDKDWLVEIEADCVVMGSPD